MEQSSTCYLIFLRYLFLDDMEFCSAFGNSRNLSVAFVRVKLKEFDTREGINIHFTSESFALSKLVARNAFSRTCVGKGKKIDFIEQIQISSWPCLYTVVICCG